MTRHKLIINVGPRITFHFFAACRNGSMTAVYWIPKYSRYSAIAPDGAQSPGHFFAFISCA
jgi:hypothetical protein